MKRQLLALMFLTTFCTHADAQNITLPPVDPPTFGAPIDPTNAYRESISMASGTVKDVSLAVYCGLISHQDGDVMDAKLTANVRTIPAALSSQTWPGGQPMFTALPESEITRASAVLQQASDDGAEESKDPKNCNELASSQDRMHVLNLLANSADIVSMAQEPVAPSGFGASLQPEGFDIASAYAAAACGYRPIGWAETLFQKINTAAFENASSENASTKQINEVSDYFNAEMKFGQGFTDYGCSLLASQGLGPLDGIEALPP